MSELREEPSAWRLRTDLAWARGLLWVASTGREVEPKRDVHLYLADRYGRLSDYFSRKGDREKAGRLNLKSEYHYRAAGPDPDQPPRAVAMALRIPPELLVDAIATSAPRQPDDVA